MQYSLRDERRDRHSGRIWRITAKGEAAQRAAADRRRLDSRACSKLSSGPNIACGIWPSASCASGRRRSEAGARRLGRGACPATIRGCAIINSKPSGPIATIGAVNTGLLRELLACDDHHARAAATQQLRYWHAHLPDHVELLRTAANDANGLVRMEAAIAASYIGTQGCARRDARRAEASARRASGLCDHLRAGCSRCGGTGRAIRHTTSPACCRQIQPRDAQSRSRRRMPPSPVRQPAESQGRQDLVPCPSGCCSR